MRDAARGLRRAVGRLGGLLFAVALIVGSTVAARAADKPALDDAERSAIEGVIHDYLLAHPEVILQAVQKLQERQKAEEEATQRQAVARHKDELFADPAAPVAGNPNGDVTIVEFFDYQCPYCKAVRGDVDRLLSEDGRVRLVLKEFPILGPASVTAAKAALAARAQGKYQVLHDALMADRSHLTDDEVMRVAKTVGLDLDQLKKDMEAPEIEAALAANLKLADQLSIRGTPAFIFGTELVGGALDLASMKSFVAAARKG